MTRSKSQIKDKVVKNVPLIWDAYPYATGAIVLVSLWVGFVLGALVF